MKKNYLVLLLGILSFLFFFSCSKINEATELGSDLIPAVDNVNTFDTTLAVETFNNLFTILNDSTRSARSDVHYIGEINSDPLFGKTKATLFLELKPTAYPFQFANKKDSLRGIDSVVLVLSYLETYGDSTITHTVRINEIDQANNFRSDTAYLLREKPFATQGALLGTRNSVDSRTLDDSVISTYESAKNQLRINLNKTFGQRLLDLDTAKYQTDSAFKTAFKGFEINATGGNSLLGFSLTDTNTKLAIYYKYKKDGKDTAGVSYFRSTDVSASANFIERNYSGSQLATYQGGTAPDDLLFLQNTPGSFATLQIPGLQNLNNRIVHRAELIVEQVYDPSDANFSPPDYLYVDAFDVLNAKYRSIPLDFVYDVNSGQINLSAFGMVGKQTTDASGNPIRVWRFNLSRYIQNVVSKMQPVYTLRLHAPFFTRNLYKSGTSEFEIPVIINPTYAKGRVRVAGGNRATQKLRLHMIYTKI